MSFFSKPNIGLCKKMLESTTLAEHEGELFCKQCYARKFVCHFSLLLLFYKKSFAYRVQKVLVLVVEQALLVWIQVNILAINLAQKWRRHLYRLLYWILSTETCFILEISQAMHHHRALVNTKNSINNWNFMDLYCNTLYTNARAIFVLVLIFYFNLTFYSRVWLNL